ncbi:glycosyltransferase [Jeotgalibacillus proteolyticus]|uniref:glycosyltransferase n=1 Tax=Jeotgalibacillus proteolyticus TaxID=2082395 RepID=UPI003CEE2214
MPEIAFIIPTISKGGAERVVTTISNSLSQEIDVIVYHRVENEYLCNKNIVNLNIPKANSIFGKIINLFYKYKEINKIKKKNGYKKIISFLDNPNLINVLTKKKNQKTIVSIRNKQSMEFKGIKKVFHKILVKHIYSKADVIVAISSGVKKDLIENFDICKKKIIVIHNPIDVDLINYQKNIPIDNTSIDDRKINVITIGRLVEQKAHVELLEAFKIYIDKHSNSNVHLTIIGDGPEEESIIKKARELELSEKVSLLPFQRNPFNIMKSSDIFILSSKYEGFGNVIVEAVACGLPIISTDCEAGPREILAPETSINDILKYPYINKNGILISSPINNQQKKFNEDLIEAMEVLLSKNDIQSNYKEINSILLTRFEKESIAKRWIEV